MLCSNNWYHCADVTDVSLRNESLIHWLTPENWRYFDFKSIKVLSPGPFFLAQLRTKLFSGRALPPTPLGSSQCSPRTHSCGKGWRGRGREGTGKKGREVKGRLPPPKFNSGYALAKNNLIVHIQPFVHLAFSSCTYCQSWAQWLSIYARQLVRPVAIPLLWQLRKHRLTLMLAYVIGFKLTFRV